MSVMITVEISGMESAKYDAVMKELGLSKRGAKWPKGIQSHVAGTSTHGVFVVDVWKSEADFKKFVEKSLGPAMAKAGVTEQPKISAIPVHFSWAK